MPFGVLAAGVSDTEIDAVKTAMEDRLADPFSAQFRDFKTSASDDGSKTVCGRVNAKNKFGAYVGFRYFIGMIFDRPGSKQLAYIVAIDDDENQSARTMCAQKKLL